MRRTVDAALKKYYQRIGDGTATAAEYEILPAMLDRLAESETAEYKRLAEEFDGMSDAGKRGDFPMEGLVNASEVCRFIGKEGVKRPADALMHDARRGLFPMPVQFRPRRWRAEDIREWDAAQRGRKRRAA